MRTLRTLLLGFTSLLFLTASMCEADEEEVDDCQTHRLEIIEIGQNFTANMTAANCEIYKAALKRFYESGCPDAAGYDEEYRETLDCSVL